MSQVITFAVEVGKFSQAVPNVCIDHYQNKKRNMICLPLTEADSPFTLILHLCYDCHQFNGRVFNQRISRVMSLSSPSNRFYNLVLHQPISRMRRPGSFSPAKGGWIDLNCKPICNKLKIHFSKA